MQGYQNSKNNPCHEKIPPLSTPLSYNMAPSWTTGSTIYQRREGKKVNTWRLVCDATLLGEKCHSTTCSQLQSTYAEVFVKLQMSKSHKNSDQIVWHSCLKNKHFFFTKIHTVKSQKIRPNCLAFMFEKQTFF